MTTVAQSTLDLAHQIPIANLSPLYPDASSHIVAQVALVWPYSSSTGTLALLLADPDIRKRKSKGQVKVVFRYGCAREVAQAKVGIGDVVRLGLVGCDWIETGDAVSTPGKKVDWDLEYRKRVVLQILRDGQGDNAAVDYTADEHSLPHTNGANDLLNGTHITRPSLNGTPRRQPSTFHVPYLTPQKHPRSVTRRTFIDDAWDSVAEDDGYVPGHGRKRTKFARNSGAWNLVDVDATLKEMPVAELDSGELEQQQGPRHEDFDLTTEAAERTEQNQAQREPTDPEPTRALSLESMRTTDEEVELSRPARLLGSPAPPEAQPAVMGPPSTPLRSLRLERLQLSREDLDLAQASPRSDATTTPRLLPIPSPGLPLVSPLIQRASVEAGYFPLMSVDLSQLDASTQTTRDLPEDGDELETEDAIDSPRSEDSLIMMDQAPNLSMLEEDVEAETVPIARDVQTIHATTDADSAMTTDETRHEQEQWISFGSSRSEPDLLVSPETVPPEGNIQTSGPIEVVEDDDMYGAPADITKPHGPLAHSLSLEQPISPLDVLEQFLQMSPTTATDALNGVEANSVENALTAPLHQNTTEVITEQVQQEKISISIIQKHSPVTYPELHSPFRQNRDQLASSNTSSRPSSAHRTQFRSLDGNIDESGPFAEYIDHLSQIATAATSAQQLAAEIRHTRGESQRDLISDGDLANATVEIGEAVRAESTVGLAEEVIQQTAEAISRDVNRGATQEEGQSSVSQPVDVHNHEVAPPDQPEPWLSQEAQAQLPTPDLSQMQFLSPEPEVRSVPKQVEAVTKTVLLSPKHTQEFDEDEVTHEDAVQDTIDAPAPENQDETTHIGRVGEAVSARNEGDMMQLLAGKTPQPTEEETAEPSQGSPQEEMQEPPPEVVLDEPPVPSVESAIPTMPSATSNLHPDTSTPRRSSQRLSARKSIMASNISSPYFTPRRSEHAPASSPIRKENIRFATPDRASLPTSPIQDKHAGLGLSTPAQDLGRGGSDLTPVPSNLRDERFVFRRDAGTATPLAYYTHLSSLHEHFGQTVDILAACAESSPQPEKAKTGPKDYHTTLRLVDPSLPSTENSAVPVQIFRHGKDALPAVSHGDAVILRNFKVQTSKRRIMLLSTETSSWAVFKARPDSSMSWSDVVISGPPIEYGPEETSRVKLLFSWWSSTGNKHFSTRPSAGERGNVAVTSPEVRSRSPTRKELPTPALKTKPASRRREDNITDHFDNESAVENFFASFANGDNVSTADESLDEEAALTAIGPTITRRETNMNDNISNGNENLKPSPRASTRRTRNRTDHVGNEGSSDGDIPDDDREKSAPLTDATNGRRQSTASLTAASESGRASFTPRRSTRQKQRKSAGLVHELRDGTKYVDGNDESMRGGSVVHELRDGVTYVDE